MYFFSIRSQCRCGFCYLGPIYPKHRGRGARRVCVPSHGGISWSYYWTACLEELSAKGTHKSFVVGSAGSLWNMHAICSMLECIPLDYCCMDYFWDYYYICLINHHLSGLEYDHLQLYSDYLFLHYNEIVIRLSSGIWYTSNLFLGG